MINNKTIRKRIVLGLFIALTFNLLCLIVWGIGYLKPSIQKVYDNSENLKNEIISQNYNSIDQLIYELEENEINYSITDFNNKIIKESKKEHTDLLFISDLIKVGNEHYLVKGYFKHYSTGWEVFFEFFKIQLILLIIMLIVVYFFSNKAIVNPIYELIDDMKNYKYGRKPTRNKLNSDIDLIQNEFVSLTESLDKNNEEKNRIIASISHDIKTPLTSIIGYSDLIKNEKNIKTIKKYNEIINIKSNHIKEITSNFDYYLINHSSKDIKFVDISIYDLIKQIEFDYKNELELNGIKFEIIADENCKKEVLELNISKIKRVFSNIISNSVKFLSENGKIIIEIKNNKNNIDFLISDNGCGVDEKIIDKIFNPLFTTDNSRKNSGLGLSIVKDNILLHKGKIKAYNNKNGGLTIEFSIPKKKES